MSGEMASGSTAPFGANDLLWMLSNVSKMTDPSPPYYAPPPQQTYNQPPMYNGSGGQTYGGYYPRTGGGGGAADYSGASYPAAPPPPMQPHAMMYQQASTSNYPMFFLVLMVLCVVVFRVYNTFQQKLTECCARINQCYTHKQTSDFVYRVLDEYHHSKVPPPVAPAGTNHQSDVSTPFE